MDKISHCVTCLKIETYMSGKNAETFSLIRFGVFIEAFWKPCRNRAVVGGKLCGRWG